MRKPIAQELEGCKPLILLYLKDRYKKDRLSWKTMYVM